MYVIPGVGVGGGAERSLVDLAPRLRSRGVDLSVTYFHERPSSAVDALRLGQVPVDRITASSAWSRWRQLRGAVRTARPDVVHTTLFEADVLGRLAAVGAPTKVVSSLVSTPYAAARRLDPGASRWGIAAARSLDAATIRRCDRVHANSEAVKAAAVAQLGVPADKVTVIPRGRDPEQLRVGTSARRAAAREALGIDLGADVVVMVGRQEPTKDHATLLEAVAALGPRRPRLVVLLAGREGAASPQIADDIARLELGEVVRPLGFRSDVADLLAAADAFAFPSLLEGMPGAVIEAMATGVPIVAAAIAPVEELIDASSGLLVPPGDAMALAAGIDAILSDPAAAAVRAAEARRRFEERHTLDVVLEATLELYQAVVDG